MAFSYSGNPAGSPLDAVRFEISDTNSAAPLLTDEEVEYAISKEASGVPPSEGEVLSAAARCMESLARLFAMQADSQEGVLQTTYSKQAKVYGERAADARRRAASMHAPSSVALSESAKQARRDDPDSVQPPFSRHQFTMPRNRRRGIGSGEGDR